MFANEYVLEFERGGRRNGYSRRFQKLLEEVRDGTELIARIEPHSYYNGAAMRAVPLGVLPTIEMVLAAAETQAKISHDTPDGIFSARAVALMSHYALYEPNSLKGLYAYCLKHLPTEDSKLFDRVFKTRWPGVPVVHTKTSSVAVNTVHAVIDLVAYQPSLMSILRQTLVWGGDTDSVAAIAWGIASCRYQNEALPSFMRTDLEAAHPSTKVHYLERIGAALMKKYA
jgi:ADP-ribosylglycohydrolase